MHTAAPQYALASRLRSRRRTTTLAEDNVGLSAQTSTVGGKNHVTAILVKGLRDSQTNLSDDGTIASLPPTDWSTKVRFPTEYRGRRLLRYVANKFANVVTIVDADPNGDGNFGDAKIAGRVLLTANANTASDDRVVGHPGMGGQGVLAIPVPYNGWVQRLPQAWKDLLTPAQINPIGSIQ